MDGSRTPMWTCPRCGHRFVTANVWHSCTTIDLDDAFAGSSPGVRATFDAFVELVNRCGDIEVIAQRSRIVIMGRVRFAGATVGKRSITLNFALTRRLDDPRFRVESYGERWNAHRFRAAQPSDLDIPGLADWLCESYRDLGMQGAPFRQRTTRNGPQPPEA
jgi:hypothetical protein